MFVIWTVKNIIYLSLTYPQYIDEAINVLRLRTPSTKRSIGTKELLSLIPPKIFSVKQGYNNVGARSMCCGHSTGLCIKEFCIMLISVEAQTSHVGVMSNYVGKEFKKYFLDEDNLVASYEWIRDLFQDTPERLSTSEEEIFIDFTSSEKLKRNFVINRSLNFG
ncbi:hypothetical protein TNCV_966401 [Trichonephila clavipes]|nr:hypothetical protein TNCV_966401 [Trichonephila clavipes]